MLKWLSNFQNKPEGYRRKATLLVSIGFTLIVVFLWLMSLFSMFGEREDAVLSADEVSTPAESLGSTFSSAWSSVKDTLDSL